MSQAYEELEGTTLCVYAYVVREGRPVGTREVMRAVNLSSPSVAFRQLQKLEELGLVEKNQFGNYVAKEKALVKGHVWVGRSLVPRLLFYSFFFVGALGAEIALFFASFFILGLAPESSFVVLMIMTAIAAALFLTEGTLLLRKLKNTQNSPKATIQQGGETD